MVALAAVATGVFCLVQVWVAQAHVIKPEGAATLVPSLSRFLGLLVAGMAIAATPRYRWFFVPALVYAVVPLLAAGPSGCTPIGPRTLIAIGGAWTPSPPNCSYPMVSGPLGAVVDLTLVLLAPAARAAIQAATGSAREGPRSQKTKISGEVALAAIAFTGFLFFLLLWGTAISSSVPYPSFTDLARFAPLFLFGILMSGTPLSRTWPLLVVPILLVTTWLADLVSMHRLLLFDVHGDALVFAVTLLGAAWHPLARLICRFRNRTSLLWTLNTLNIADAALSAVVVGSGIGAESNPLVRVVGLPVKVIAVAIAGSLIARVRPKALLWPVIVLAGVIAWHVTGIVVSS